MKSKTRSLQSPLDTSTNYYRINGEGNGVQDSNNYHGVSFRENGVRNASDQLMSVGIR